MGIEWMSMGWVTAIQAIKHLIQMSIVFQSFIVSTGAPREEEGSRRGPMLEEAMCRREGAATGPRASASSSDCQIPPNYFKC